MSLESVPELAFHDSKPEKWTTTSKKGTFCRKTNDNTHVADSVVPVNFSCKIGKGCSLNKVSVSTQCAQAIGTGSSVAWDQTNKFQ